MSSKNIIAIDVGFGNTKLAWVVHGGPAKEMIFSSQTLRSSESAGGDIGISQLDRVQVLVNKQLFWVGPDMAGEGSNELHGDYSGSDAYEALVIGALHYIAKAEGMTLDVIDFLVLGLPVSNFSQKKDALIKRFSKNLQIPNPAGLRPIYGPNFASSIKKVAVLPQPMGSMLHYIELENNSETFDKTHLVIDPGYLTVDWFTSKGAKAVLERSGAFNGGVSAILNEVGKAFLKDTGISINEYVVDTALRNGFTNLMGKRYDFVPYRIISERKASSIVALLLAEINSHQVDRSSGKAISIDNVILTGGGATFFEKPMREQFPGQFTVLDEAVMGNVKGYLEFGKRLAMHLI